jgi:hypothetical protein
MRVVSGVCVWAAFVFMPVSNDSTIDHIVFIAPLVFVYTPLRSFLKSNRQMYSYLLEVPF